MDTDMLLAANDDELMAMAHENQLQILHEENDGCTDEEQKHNSRFSANFYQPVDEQEDQAEENEEDANMQEDI